MVFVGEIYGRLTVIEFSHTLAKNRYWRCLCVCGAEVTVPTGRLRSGNTKSCGCLRVDVRKSRGGTAHTHGYRCRAGGQKADPTYRAWIAMRQRCNNPNNPAYLNYGFRGISVCERWAKFENFLSDMGDCPAGMSIERVDNNLGYSKDNCVWATASEQNRNKRGVKLSKEDVRLIMDDSRTHDEIAKDFGVSRSNISCVKRGATWT